MVSLFSRFSLCHLRVGGCEDVGGNSEREKEGERREGLASCSHSLYFCFLRSCLELEHAISVVPRVYGWALGSQR